MPVTVHFLDRVHRPASGPVAVGIVLEVSLEDRLDHNLEIANTVEPIQDDRIYIEKINVPMLYEYKATPPGVSELTAHGCAGCGWDDVCSHRGAGPGSMVGGLARGTGLEDVPT
jgi:hypothetical protein